MITAGLSGGICSGKSTVSKTFIKNNIPVIDADIIARKVVEPCTPGHGCIKTFFGKEYFNSDDTLNREALGKLIFSDKNKRLILDSIMMPLIAFESARQIAEAHKNNPIVIYDAAIIVEMGNADKYRPLIIVSCPPEIQLERLMKRNGFTREHALERIESQMPLAQKIKSADFVIDTSDTIEQSIAQTEKIIDQLIVMYTKQNHSKMDRLP